MDGGCETELNRRCDVQGRKLIYSTTNQPPKTNPPSKLISKSGSSFFTLSIEFVLSDVPTRFCFMFDVKYSFGQIDGSSMRQPSSTSDSGLVVFLWQMSYQRNAAGHTRTCTVPSQMVRFSRSASSLLLVPPPHPFPQCSSRSPAVKVALCSSRIVP